MRQRMVALAAGVLALIGQTAMAQSLSTEVVTAVVLTEAQKGEVREYARAHSKNLASADAIARKADKDALLSPLEPSKTPSAAFRIEFSKALQEPLGAAAGAGLEGMISALVIGGELATPDTLEQIRGAMRSTNPAVRHQAGGLTSRSVFRAVLDAARSGTAPAVTDEQLSRLIDDLAAGAAGEKNDIVLDAWVNSLARAAEIDGQRAAAFAGLARVVDAQTKAGSATLTGARLGAMMRAVDEGVLRQLAQPGRPVAPEAARSAARLSGHLIARAMKAARENTIPAGAEDPERALWGKICATCQNTIGFAGRALQTGFSAPIPDAAAELKKGTRPADAAFILEAEKICGRDGMLTRAPFDIPASALAR